MIMKLFKVQNSVSHKLNGTNEVFHKIITYTENFPLSLSKTNDYG